MRILILSRDDYPHVGGKSTHIASIIEGYKKNGVEAEVLCQECINGFLFNFIRLLLLPIRLFSKEMYVIIWNNLVIYLFSGKIYRKCKNTCFDVISAQDAISAVACKQAKLKLKIPVVLTMHTYFGIEYSLDNGLSVESLLYQRLLELEKSCLYITDAVIAVDTRIKEHITDNYRKMKITHFPEVVAIPNFTNTDLLKPIRNSEIREQYGISVEEMLVLCVRRLVEKNGVIFAVEAISYIMSNTHIKLLILGSGSEEEKIKDAIEKSGLQKRVILCGSVANEEVYRYYRAADCVVVPSITVNGLQEATSISAIEAMSCGIPVIASDIGGLSELVNNGKDGILVNEANSRLIADALIKLYENPTIRKRLGAEARANVIKNYSHIAAAKKYLSEFDRCIKENN